MAANAESGGGFDKLPDHLVLDILAKCCAKTSCVSGSATIRGLSRLRTVCCRFDRVIPQVERVIWEIEEEAPRVTAAARFLQGLPNVKSLSIWNVLESDDLEVIELPDAVLHVIAGATFNLEYFEIVDHIFDSRLAFLTDAQVHDLFRVLSLCPKLQAIKLHCGATFEEALPSRYQLKILASLHLVGASLEDGCLTSILGVCPGLETLHLIQTSQLETPVIQSEKLCELTVDMDVDSDDVMSLGVKAPLLKVLGVSKVVCLSIDAPKLTQLTVDNVDEVVKESPWRLSTLHVKSTRHSWTVCLKILQVCTVVCNPTKEAAQTKKRTRVSKSLHNVPALEELKVSLRLDDADSLMDRGIFPLSSEVAGLKTLVVDVQGAHFGEVLEVFLLVPQFASKLEVLKVHLPSTLHGRAGLWISRFMKLQKEHPQLKVDVTSD